MIDDATEVSRSILIVDDDIRIRNSLSGALSGDGTTVSAVSSAGNWRRPSAGRIRGRER